MVRNWLSELRKSLILSCAAVLAAAGVSRAQQTLCRPSLTRPPRRRPPPAAGAGRRAGPATGAAEEDRGTGRHDPQRPGPAGRRGGGGPQGRRRAPKPLSEADVKKIVGDYLKENPGANLPTGVPDRLRRQQGLRHPQHPRPQVDQLGRPGKIPFELRIRGRLQPDYYYYKATDNINHLTGLPATPGGTPSPGANAYVADFSQLEIKRMRLDL